MDVLNADVLNADVLNADVLNEVLDWLQSNNIPRNNWLVVLYGDSKYDILDLMKSTAQASTVPPELFTKKFNAKLRGGGPNPYFDAVNQTLVVAQGNPCDVVDWIIDHIDGVGRRCYGQYEPYKLGLFVCLAESSLQLGPQNSAKQRRVINIAC
jgi:hypothetical protein